MGLFIESIHSTVQVMECGFDIQIVTQIETSMYSPGAQRGLISNLSPKGLSSWRC